MLKLKSAQLNSKPDFTSTDVRRVFGHAYDVLQTQKKFDVLRQLQEQERELMQTNPRMSLEDLAATPMWELLQSILGHDYWAFKPQEGILGL